MNGRRGVAERIKNIYNEIAKLPSRLKRVHLLDDHRYRDHSNIYPVYAFEYGANPEACISSGMHCQEWTEIYAHLNFLKNLKAHDNVPSFVSIPFINPVGMTKYPKRDRSNWRWGSQAKREGGLQRTVRDYLSHFDFRASLDMHEDVDTWDVYIYERAKAESLAKKILDELHYPAIEAEDIYGDKCTDGVVKDIHYRPSLKTEKTFERMMFSDFNVDYSLTSEVPGKLPERHRIRCGTAILKLFMKHLQQR